MTEQELKDLIKERINDLMEKRGSNMRSLSRSLGFSEGYINQIMNNNMMPSLSAVLMLAEAMNMTPSEFLDNSEKRPLEYYKVNKDIQNLSAKRLEALSILLQEENENARSKGRK